MLRGPLATVGSRALMILVVSHLAVQLVKRTIGRPRLSRVVLGVHFPGDVLSGQLIAILTAVPFILV